MKNRTSNDLEGKTKIGSFKKALQRGVFAGAFVLSAGYSASYAQSTKIEIDSATVAPGQTATVHVYYRGTDPIGGLENTFSYSGMVNINNCRINSNLPSYWGEFIDLESSKRAIVMDLSERPELISGNSEVYSCEVQANQDAREGVYQGTCINGAVYGSTGIIEDVGCLNKGLIINKNGSGTPTATPTPAHHCTHSETPTSTNTPYCIQSATRTPTNTRTRTPTPCDTNCVGDCNDDGNVTVDELVKGVDIALGNSCLNTCPDIDEDGDGNVTVNELITSINNGLKGCK